MKSHPESLKQLEHRLGRLLITGVTASAIMLAAGTAITLVSPDSIVGSWLLTIGLIILMATPIMRVLVSFGQFLKLRDWLFVSTTLIVLAELTLTVVYALTR